MAKAKQEDGTAVVDASVSDAFYWLGMLPATGPVTLILPDDKKGLEEEVTYSAYDLWNGKYDNEPVFAPKLRQYTGLRVRDWHFHSVSQAIIRSGTQRDSIAYPGNVAWLSSERIDQIAQACNQVFVRWPHGIQLADNPRAKVEVWDAMQGRRPDGMTDEDWSAFLKHKRTVCPAFNPRTDKWVSEFVYIKRLDFKRENLDELEYEKMPGKFHVQMVGTFGREFFTNPPKSVAEMYPQA